MTGEVDLFDEQIETLYRRSQRARRRLIVSTIGRIMVAVSVAMMISLGTAALLRGVRAEQCVRVGVALERPTRYDGPLGGCVVELKDGGTVSLEDYEYGE